MSSQTPPVIFIIDDNPSNVKVLSETLKSFGYKTLVAMDGLSGIQKITKALPDLILLDILMPEIDGFEVCQRLKQSEVTRDIPIIFMTALASTADKVKGLKLGAVDYITKPFQEEELIARLDLHLQLRYLSQDLAEQNQKLQAEIAQREAAEAQIRILSKVSEQSPASILITNVQGNIEYVNPKFEELTGYRLEDVIGKNPRILKSGETSSEEYAHIWKLLSNGLEWHGEFHNKKRNGELYWEQASISSIKDDNGEITHYVAIKEDITLRKQAELELYQQLERERMVSELTLSIRQSLDLSQILDTVVKELKRILGIDRVLAYQIFADGTGKAVAEAVNENLDKVLDLVFSSGIFPRETYQIYIEGKVHHVDNCDNYEMAPCLHEFLHSLGVKAKLVAPVLKNENSLWGLLVAHHHTEHHWQDWEIEFFHQVSNQLAIAISQANLYQQIQIELAEKIQAEKALQVLNQELENRVEQRTADLLSLDLGLQKNTERLALALKSGAIGCWEWDIQQNILIWDDRMYELYGYLKETNTHLPYEIWANAVHPDDLNATETVLQQAVLGQLEFDYDFRVIHPDRSIHFIKAYGKVKRDSQGNAESMIGVNFDITDRKQIEIQLEKNNESLALANIELARATRLKDEFLANMSHELRTPLNAILGMSESLQEGVLGELNERQKKAVTTIESGGQHLLALITDILDLAKIESGKLELHIENAGIERLCNDSFVFIKQLAHKKNIQLICNIPDRLKQNQSVYIQVDELRMRQALINLLTNAVKFTPDGGTVTLEVKLTEIANEEGENKVYIDFLVIDTGIGIKSEDIDKLFQNFVQIDSALNRKYAGTGLGLSLVKKIAEMHGGSVGIESEFNIGSKFMIRLPYQTDSSTNHPINLQSAISETSEYSGNGDTSYQVLVADDNMANMETIRGYLQSRNYEVSTASDGKMAVDMAIDLNPDIILMDIQMPEMDGLTAIKLIRANPETANIPIIALTALAMNDDREKCLAAGANEYMSKPFRLRTLANTIQDYCDRLNNHEET